MGIISRIIFGLIAGILLSGSCPAKTAAALS